MTGTDAAPQALLRPGSRPWLHVFATVVRSGTLASLDRVNTCIATTAIGAHVLGRYGIKAKPFSVLVHAYNMKAMRLREQRVPISEWPDDAWLLGIDPNMVATDIQHDGRGWSGHLVLMVRQPGEPRLLIDLTADQMDRPHRSLEVGGPVFMDIRDGAIWTPQDALSTIIGGRDEKAEESLARNATVVEYRPAPPTAPHTNAWRESPDWLALRDPADPSVVRIVDDACAAIDAQVAEIGATR